MLKKLFLFLGIFAALATSSLAQNNKSQNVSGPNVNVRLTDLEGGLARYIASNDDSIDATGRARVVEAKSSAVKSSVIVNVARVERIAFELVNQKACRKRPAAVGMERSARSDRTRSFAKHG